MKRTAQPQPKQTKQPAYRHRLLRGKHKAVVTLVDAVSKKVKDHFLGEWDDSTGKEITHRTPSAPRRAWRGGQSGPVNWEKWTMLENLTTREHEIQNAILRVFGTRPELRLWRANSGVARMGPRRIVCFGVPGQTDLTGILPGGIRLEIECKSVGGRQSHDQKYY